MKGRLILYVLIAGIVAASPAAARRVMDVAVGEGVSTISLLTGRAEVQEEGRGPWSGLKVNDTLAKGDRVRTGAEARMELLLPDMSRLRFSGGSEFNLVTMTKGTATRPQEARVHVALGKAWAKVTQHTGGSFELSCDKAIAGVRGTIYRLNVEKDTSALIRVYEGTVYVSGGRKAVDKPVPVGPPTKVPGPTPIAGPRKVTMEEWTVIVRSMQEVRISAEGIPEKPRDFTAAEDMDEWVEWNKKLDQMR